ncbi:hypothetical protein GMRT_10470 [Giardia muris]|uniref:Leucine-rich repeat protein n=1 Tax=Giardia muris TaxID=5742 RepID=A0A4Z1T1V2_GIAMU|nr:hypothetical protein GMRT_10470 [Giardia muris]|eukprot:TNJ26539.1 hypothetical protein GMRT_10470 [Giardia muris]
MSTETPSVPRFQEVFSISSKDVQKDPPEKSPQRPLQPKAWKPSLETLQQIVASNVLTPQVLYDEAGISLDPDSQAGSPSKLKALKKEAFKQHLRFQTRLDLAGRQLSSITGFPNMKVLMPNLVEVNATGNKLNPLYFFRFNCQVLILSDNLIDDDAVQKSLEVHSLLQYDAEKLARAHLFETLSVLDLSGNLLVDFYLLAALIAIFPNLRTLILSSNTLTIPFQTKPIHTSSLVRNIPATRQSGTTPDAYSTLPVSSSLTTLILDNVPMSPQLLVAIATAFPNLERLSLRASGMTSELLSYLLGFQSLIELDISDNPELGSLEPVKVYVMHHQGFALSRVAVHNSVGVIQKGDQNILFMWFGRNNTFLKASRNIYARPETTQRTVEVSLYQRFNVRQAMTSSDVNLVRIDTALPTVSVPTSTQPSEAESFREPSLLELDECLDVPDTALDRFNQQVINDDSIITALKHSLSAFVKRDEPLVENTRDRRVVGTAKPVVSTRPALPPRTDHSSSSMRMSHLLTRSHSAPGGLSIASVLSGIGAPPGSMAAQMLVDLTMPSYPTPTGLGGETVEATDTTARTKATQKNRKSTSLRHTPAHTRHHLILGTGESEVDTFLVEALTKHRDNGIIISALESIDMNLYRARLRSLSPIDEGHRSTSTFHISSEAQPPLSTSELDLNLQSSQLLFGNTSLESSLVMTSVASFTAINKLNRPMSVIARRSLLDDIEDLDNGPTLSPPRRSTDLLVKRLDDFEAAYQRYKQGERRSTEDFFQKPTADNTANICQEETSLRPDTTSQRTRSAPLHRMSTSVTSHSVRSAAPPPGPETFLTGLDYVQPQEDSTLEPDQLGLPRPTPEDGVFADALLTRRVREGLEAIMGPTSPEDLMLGPRPREEDIISFLPRGYGASLRDIYTALRHVLENPITSYNTLSDEEVLESLFRGPG